MISLSPSRTRRALMTCAACADPSRSCHRRGDLDLH